jgi:carboxypeptidase Taq
MSYKKIIEIYNEYTDLTNTLSLLNWDQSTYMPKQGVGSRADAVSTLTRISHEMIISEPFYELLQNTLETDVGRQMSPDERSEILRIKEDVEKERKIPTSLACETAKTTSIATNVWEKSRADNNDKEFLPILKNIFDLKKDLANCLGFEKNPYDALLDSYDRGMKYSMIEPLFNELEKDLRGILKTIDSSVAVIDDSFLSGKYEYAKLWDFGISMLAKMGIDDESFRQDTSAHPFTTTIGTGDVRITTNIRQNDFKKGFYSTIHEGGHALYEIGAQKKLGRSIFAKLDSLSLHESQSRFYENIICRSYGFWETYYSKLKDLFPETLSKVGLESFYYAINKVENHPIRIESDEVTYNLHIILRTKIENDILNGKVRIEDINDVWNERTRELFGFYPENKSMGYMQDIHWSDGLIGYFPTYSVGNIISAQLFSTMKENKVLSDKVNDETLITIQRWLSENIYACGTKFTAAEVIKNTTSKDLDSSFFIRYLRNKYSEIYKID